MSNKKYQEVKFSGVSWIGMIPSHWSRTKLKYSDKVVMGQSPKSEDCNQEAVGNPFLQGNAQFGILHPEPNTWCEVPNKLARVNDVLLSVRAPVGAVNIADQITGIGRGLCAIQEINTSYKLLYYYLQIAREELISKGTGSTFTAVSVDDVENLPLLSIPKLEQKAIVSFLDSKTAKIDKLIQLKERKIELLKEQRTALINQVVTKGLDPNVEMKDSGVEWIGEIPRNWEIKKLKYWVDFSNGYAFKSEEYQDEGIPVIRIGDVKELVDAENSKRISSKYIDLLPEFCIKKGDILIALTGATIGKVGVYDSNKPALLNQRVGNIQTSNPSEQIFLYFLLNTIAFKRFVQLESDGGAQGNIGTSDIGEFLAPFPPIEQIEEIGTILKGRLHQNNLSILTEERKIQLLKEYRQSLISEVVTGKIRVTEEDLSNQPQSQAS